MQENCQLDKDTIEKIKKIPVGYSNTIIQTFFILGVVSAVLLRAVKLMAPFSPEAAKICWYVAVIGYCFFFMHRFNVSRRRKSAIKCLNLLKKIENQEPLSPIDYNALNYVLWSLSVSKEKINYIVILIFSAIAIPLALYMDLTH